MRTGVLLVLGGLGACTFTPAPGGEDARSPGSDASTGPDAGRDRDGGPRPDAASVDAAPDAAVRCAGFAPMPGGQAGHTCLVLPGSADWATTTATCVGLGGYLAVPASGAELDGLATLVAGLDDEFAWLGVRDDPSTDADNDWISQGGEAAFLRWWGGGRGFSAEPDGGMHDCLLLNRRRDQFDGTFTFDGQCAPSYRAVCECVP